MEMTFGRKSSSCSMSEGVMCALTGTDRFSRIMNKAPDVPGETHGNKGRRNPRGLGHSQGIRAAKKSKSCGLRWHRPIDWAALEVTAIAHGLNVEWLVVISVIVGFCKGPAINAVKFIKPSQHTGLYCPSDFPMRQTPNLLCFTHAWNAILPMDFSFAVATAADANDVVSHATRFSFVR